MLSVVVYLLFQWLEDSTGKPLFTFPGGIPYDKSSGDGTTDPEKEKYDDSTKAKSDDLTDGVSPNGTMMWKEAKFHSPEEVYA